MIRYDSANVQVSDIMATVTSDSLYSGSVQMTEAVRVAAVLILLVVSEVVDLASCVPCVVK